jgi:ribosomal protein L11
MDDEVFHVLTIYIRANSAEATPPLGTVLGNLGLNSIKFCKEFNEFTVDLPNYITLGVSITVMLNRTYSFKIISGPSMGQLFYLLKERNERLSSRPTLSLKTLVQVTLYKFPNIPLKYTIPVVMGMIKAADISIYYEKQYK